MRHERERTQEFWVSITGSRQRSPHNASTTPLLPALYPSQQYLSIIQRNRISQLSIASGFFGFANLIIVVLTTGDVRARGRQQGQHWRRTRRGNTSAHAFTALIKHMSAATMYDLSLPDIAFFAWVRSLHIPEGFRDSVCKSKADH